MKAAVYERYGPPEVIAVREVPRPDPGPGEVLVRVHAASVNPGDWHMLTADPWLVRLFQGFWRPKLRVLGVDGSGVVEAVGDGVTRFQPGDAVHGSSAKFGWFAEYAAVPEKALAPKPASLDWVEAAAVGDASNTALQGLRDHGGLRDARADATVAGAPQRVLIVGASGGIGTFAVQIAKAFGARVDAVCSTRNVELVRSLGADRVIDYTQQRWTEMGERWDLILDQVCREPLAACKRARTDNGVYVAMANRPGRMLRVALTGGKRVKMPIASAKAEDYATINALVEAGSLRPSVERVHPLDQIRDALAHMGSKKTRGKIVVRVAG